MTTSIYDGCEVCELISDRLHDSIHELPVPDELACLPIARNFSVEKAEEMLRNVCCRDAYQTSFPSLSQEEPGNEARSLHVYVTTCVKHCV